MGRTVDIFTGPAQGALTTYGATRRGAVVSANRYVGGGDIETEITPAFDMNVIEPNAGGIGTVLVLDWIRSKKGEYRGLGRKKILSGIMAANPEILASTEQNPVEALAEWNEIRIEYDRAYDPSVHQWSLNPNTSWGTRFWKSMGFDVGLKITQKVAERFINPMLPPGYNF